jgi:protein-S-isoprenylcysteine O-methyltransferase Ste14
LPDSGTLRRILTPLFAGGFAVWMASVHFNQPRGPIRWLGLALAIIGIAGVTVSRWTLGKSFAVTPQARELVTRGIYSRIRNPIYVSGTVFIAGVLLIMDIPWLWAALVALVIVQVLRAHKEAAVLEAKFGDEYRRYRAQTWF